MTYHSVIQDGGIFSWRYWRHFALALALTASTPLWSSPIQTEMPEVFSEGTLAEAKVLAAKDGKMIFVDFFTTWCPPCKLLDTTTWQDAGVRALLREKTVALRINAEKEKELAKQYRVEAYPTLLVLKEDGTEIDRYVGYLDAEKFRTTLAATLAGKPSLQQAREALGVAEDPRARMNLARKLAQTGQAEEALAHYLWCYDVGPDADPGFAQTAGSSLVAALGALGRNYPPALAALRSRRDTLQAKVLVDLTTVEPTTAARLAALDLALRDDEAIIDTLAKLPEGGRARKSYGGMLVLMRLVEKKHYGAALSLGSPEVAYQAQIDQVTQVLAKLAASGRAVPPLMEENMKKMPRLLGTVYVIALAGAGETERARALAAKVLEQSSDAATRDEMVKGLREAGLAELADALSLPEAIPPSVRP